MTHTEHAAQAPAPGEHRHTGMASGLLTRGGIAGLFAGFAFLLANMWYAVSQGKPAVGPLLGIATVFHASDMPVATPQNMVIGLVTHIALSLAFGMGFAVLLMMVPPLRHGVLLVITAVLYGLALYVLNFQILGRTAFPFFNSERGPNQWLEGLIHPFIFGLLLTPFFFGAGRKALHRS